MQTNVFYGYILNIGVLVSWHFLGPGARDHPPSPSTLLEFMCALYTIRSLL